MIRQCARPPCIRYSTDERRWGLQCGKSLLISLLYAVMSSVRVSSPCASFSRVVGFGQISGAYADGHGPLPAAENQRDAVIRREVSYWPQPSVR